MTRNTSCNQMNQITLIWTLEYPTHNIENFARQHWQHWEQYHIVLRSKACEERGRLPLRSCQFSARSSPTNNLNILKNEQMDRAVIFTFVIFHKSTLTALRAVLHCAQIESLWAKRQGAREVLSVFCTPTYLPRIIWTFQRMNKWTQLSFLPLFNTYTH